MPPEVSSPGKNLVHTAGVATFGGHGNREGLRHDSGPLTRHSGPAAEPGVLRAPLNSLAR
jgi:hypothetical protein